MPWPLGNMGAFGQPVTTASGQRYQPQSLVNSKPQSMQPQNHQPQQFLYNNSGKQQGWRWEFQGVGAISFHLPRIYSPSELWVQILCYYKTFLKKRGCNCTHCTHANATPGMKGIIDLYSAH